VKIEGFDHDFCVAALNGSMPSGSIVAPLFSPTHATNAKIKRATAAPTAKILCKYRMCDDRILLSGSGLADIFGTALSRRGFHSMRRVETQSIRDVAIGSMARLSHQVTSSPKLWLSR
jgi:hypothetical protein